MPSFFSLSTVDDAKVAHCNAHQPTQATRLPTSSVLSTVFHSLVNLVAGKKQKRTDPFPTSTAATHKKAKEGLARAFDELHHMANPTMEPLDSSRGLYGPAVLSGEERKFIQRTMEKGVANNVEIQVQTPSGQVTSFAVINDEHMTLLHNTKTDLVEYMNVMNAEEDVPKDLNAVLGCPQRKAWLASIKKEFRSLIDTGSVRVVLLKPGRKLLGTKLVLKRKMTSDGTMLKSRKARLTLQGFAQRENLEYSKIFSPTCSLTTLRVMGAVSCHFDLEWVNFDFETAFLQSLMSNSGDFKLYCDYPHGMRPPKHQKESSTAPSTKSTPTAPTTDDGSSEASSTKDWEDGPDTCLQVVRSIYGAKQSPRNFNILVHNWFVSPAVGFRRSTVDSCCYIKEQTVGGKVHKIWDERTSKWDEHTIGGKVHRIWVLLYVDDLAVMYDARNPVTKQMYEVFKTKLMSDFLVEYRGNLEHFLGYKAVRDRKNRKLKLTQAASLLKALKEAGMEQTERKMTPAPPDCKPHKKDCPDLSTDEGRKMKQEMDGKPYANRVGSLLWLARTYRFDISWVVGMLTRFMATPGRAHWAISSYVYKFLSTTKDRGLTYSYKPDGMKLVGSSDANHLCDYGDEKENRRNTLGWAFFLGGAAISVRSRKAQRASCSSCESETQALWDAIRECIWLRRVCKEFGIEQTESTVIECDSQIAIRLTEEHCESERSKHWDAEYQLIREEVGQRESVSVKFVETALQVSDVLTKPVTRGIFERHSRRLLGEEWLFDSEVNPAGELVTSN